MEHMRKGRYPDPTPEQFADLKKSFGDECTDEQLMALHQELEAWAELLLDIYYDKHNRR